MTIYIRVANGSARPVPDTKQPQYNAAPTATPTRRNAAPPPVGRRNQMVIVTS